MRAQIAGLHPDLKRKVRSALEVIREDPTEGKVLHEELAGLRSFRIGQFRIVYRVARAHVIEIVALGPRRTIYGDTARLLRREGDERP